MCPDSWLEILQPGRACGCLFVAPVRAGFNSHRPPGNAGRVRATALCLGCTVRCPTLAVQGKTYTSTCTELDVWLHTRHATTAELSVGGSHCTAAAWRLRSLSHSHAHRRCHATQPGGCETGPSPSLSQIGTCTPSHPVSAHEHSGSTQQRSQGAGPPDAPSDRARDAGSSDVP